MLPNESAAIIVGGRPCGLMLANELGRRNIGAVLIDEKPGTAFNPQANATQARTMEHFRRLGFAMNVSFNRGRRAFMRAVDGKGEFAFDAQLHAHERENRPQRHPAIRVACIQIGDRRCSEWRRWSA